MVASESAPRLKQMSRPRILVAILWLAFVVRGCYYCAQVPIWEGLDEWAHFAALQYFAEHGHMPARSDPIADEVMRSLELTPLPWSNNGWIAGAVNHDEFWRLPQEQRAQRLDELGHLNASYRRPANLPPSSQRQYEAQQAPLYYLVLFPAYQLSRGWSLPAQVTFLRVLGVLLASAVVPLTYAIARLVPAARKAAIPVTAFVAAMPAAILLISRVGNDTLAVPLMTLALYYCVAGKRPIPAGLTLGAALLTKGYAIVLVPVFAVRNRKALAIALLIAGWWYAGNLVSTRTLTGDQMMAGASTRLPEIVNALHQIAWIRVIDFGATTHIWIGGWSFLQLRSWMYRVWEVIALTGLCGLALLTFRRPRILAGPAGILMAVQALFLLAAASLAFATFLTLHASAGAGWYLVAICAAEAALLACGFAGMLGLRRARIAMAGVVLLALVLDLYTVHFLLAPYYSGLIRHRPNGTLEAFHWSFRLPLPRLWPTYLAANAALAWVTLRSLRNRRPAPEHRP